MIAQVGFIYYSCKLIRGLFPIFESRLPMLLTDEFLQCFLSCADDPRFWWFEVWDLGRKLFLNCMISLLAKAGANRIIAGLLVL